jgi:hypothetical protein
MTTILSPEECAQWERDHSGAYHFCFHIRALATIASLRADLDAARRERQDALDMHRGAHESWRALMDEHNSLRARVAELEAALREILRDTDEPFGFASYDEAHAFAAQVLGVARAALAPQSAPEAVAMSVTLPARADTVCVDASFTVPPAKPAPVALTEEQREAASAWAGLSEEQRDNIRYTLEYQAAESRHGGDVDDDEQAALRLLRAFGGGR